MNPGEELAQSLDAPVGALDGTKIVPMLCEREEAGLKVVARKGWVFELKLDGVRILADKQTDRVTLSYLSQAARCNGELPRDRSGRAFARRYAPRARRRDRGA